MKLLSSTHLDCPWKSHDTLALSTSDFC